MPYKVKLPERKEFFLTKTDEVLGCEGEASRIVIKQAAQGENTLRSDLHSTYRQSLTTQEIIQNFSFLRLAAREVFLTLCECNLLGMDGKELFPCKDGKIDLTEVEFNKRWDSLDPVAALEIHDKVLLVNPGWSAMGEG